MERVERQEWLRTGDGGVRPRSVGEFIREHAPVIIMVLLALAVRLALFAAVRPWDDEVARNTILVMDAAGYHKLALGIMQSGSFIGFGTFRTPVYPLFLAGIYSVFGVKVWVAILIQILMSAATGALVYAWTRPALGKTVAVVAAGVFAVQPHTAFHSLTLLTDTLFTFVFLLSMIALFRGLRRRSVAALVASGVLLGVATLVRPVTQYFPLVMVLLVVLYRGLDWRFRAAAVAAIVLAFFVSVAPWSYRNYREYGHHGLCTIQGENLLFYGASYAEAARTGTDVDEIRADFLEVARQRGASEDGNPFDNSKIYKEVAVSYIKAHPVLYAKRNLRGILNMFFNLSTTQFCKHLNLRTGDLPYRYFAAPGMGETIRGFLRSKSAADIIVAGVVGAIILVTYLSALLGFGAALRQRSYMLLAATVLIILYFSATVGPIGKARYKLPLVPFFVALSGLGLVNVWRLTARRRGRA